jgi:putative ABC transport system permease protein
VARLAWSQLRFAAVRVIALLAGLLLATTAFTVLTAASRTAQLRTVGTVSSHFQPTCSPGTDGRTVRAGWVPL